MKITNRIEACKCGCHGKDPWHARQFSRVLRNVREASGQADTKAFKTPHDIAARADVSLPWGDGTAVLVLIQGHKIGWYVEA